MKKGIHRYIRSALAAAMAFHHAALPVNSEETDASDHGRKGETMIREEAPPEKETTEPGKIPQDSKDNAPEAATAGAKENSLTVYSVFLESFPGHTGEESIDEIDSILTTKKTADLGIDSEIKLDYDLRAPENDEFALYHGGAILNGDHYLLDTILINADDDIDVKTDIEDINIIRSGAEEETDSAELTLIYRFVQPYYIITVRYLDNETEEELFESEGLRYSGSTSLKGAVSYDVREFQKIRFEGYAYAGTSGDPAAGEADSDKTINILYRKHDK